jgi:hypothetical protein
VEASEHLALVPDRAPAVVVAGPVVAEAVLAEAVVAVLAEAVVAVLAGVVAVLSEAVPAEAVDQAVAVMAEVEFGAVDLRAGQVHWKTIATACIYRCPPSTVLQKPMATLMQGSKDYSPDSD